jgi:hypothetical protein
MSLSRCFIICLTISLFNTSCKHAGQKSSYLDILKPADSLKLWYDHSNRVETIWVVKQSTNFKVCYQVEKYNDDYLAIISGEKSRNEGKPIRYTVTETCKFMAENEVETVGEYIKTFHGSYSNVEPVQGYVVFSKKFTEVGADTTRDRKKFDAVLQNIFNIK